MKQVSIIIVTYNSEKDIFDCVDAIKAHADIPLADIELIIVDNNSREPQPMFQRLQKQWGDDIICIENTKNGGYGQGNNVGIRCATAPIILIMNPDVRLIQPCLAKGILEFQKSKSLIMYGMKQMLTPDIPSTYPFGATLRINGYIRPVIMAIAARLDTYLPRIMYLDGSCFFVRRSMFLEVGLFDEENFLYAEEDDIHYRLTHRFGYDIRYDKTLRYLHLTLGRKFDVEYELQRVKASVLLNEKKGYSRTKTIRNFIRTSRVLLWREQLREVCGHKSEIRPLLEDLLTQLESMI